MSARASLRAPARCALPGALLSGPARAVALAPESKLVPDAGW